MTWSNRAAHAKPAGTPKETNIRTWMYIFRMRSKDYELRTLGARISFLLRCCQRIWHRAHDVRLELQPKLMWIQTWCRHHISTWLISNHWQFSANKDHMRCLQSCLVATFQRYSSLVEIVSSVWHASSVCIGVLGSRRSSAFASWPALTTCRECRAQKIT